MQRAVGAGPVHVMMGAAELPLMLTCSTIPSVPAGIFNVVLPRDLREERISA